MNLHEMIIDGIAPRPRRVMIYGTHGIGKSTFAANAPSPVFIQTEDGLGTIDCKRLPLARDYETVLDQLGLLYQEDHSFQSLVIDSLDWLEMLVHKQVCADHGKNSIAEIGYGKGYEFALDKLKVVIGGLDALRNDRGMNIVLIAHAKIERYENPATDSYDRYSPKLHKSASALFQEWCDEALFANYETFTKQEAKKFEGKTTKGFGTGERLLYTQERPAFLAKNRLNLPPVLPLDWGAYQSYWPKSTGP